MSIDGRIALKNGTSKWITSKHARQDVQKLRAKSSAILSTSSTILHDNSLMTIRSEDFDEKTLSVFPHKNFQHPIRVIIDSQNRITLSHKIIQTKAPIWLIRLKSDKQLWPEYVKQIIVKKNNKKIDILSVLKLLGQYEINNLWIEAGSTFSGLLLEKELIDEIIIYIAPKILGNQAKPLFILQNKLTLLECIQLKIQDIYPIGPDIRLKLTPIYKKI